MPLLHVNATKSGVDLHESRHGLYHALDTALTTPGPVIIMIHGFKFAPGVAGHCPHDHILSADDSNTCWKALSWPRALGFGAGHAQEGLGIAFGWEARGTIWSAYAQAERVGLQLADLIRMIRRIAPKKDIHLFGHSLGARVALSALPHVGAGDVRRLILLAGAEYGRRAEAALDTPAGRTAEVVNISSRENDVYDFMLERFIAPSERGDTTLAHGLRPARGRVTIQIDHAETLDCLRRAGFDIAAPNARVCHWSCYLRPGVFDLYSALMREPENPTLAQLRAALPEAPEPRWSRMLALPQPRGWGWAGRGAAAP